MGRGKNEVAATLAAKDSFAGVLGNTRGINVETPERDALLHPLLCTDSIRDRELDRLQHLAYNGDIEDALDGYLVLHAHNQQHIPKAEKLGGVLLYQFREYIRTRWKPALERLDRQWDDDRATISGQWQGTMIRQSENFLESPPGYEDLDLYTNNVALEALAFYLARRSCNHPLLMLRDALGEQGYLEVYRLFDPYTSDAKSYFDTTSQTASLMAWEEMWNETLIYDPDLTPEEMLAPERLQPALLEPAKILVQNWLDARYPHGAI